MAEHQAHEETPHAAHPFLNPNGTLKPLRQVEKEVMEFALRYREGGTLSELARQLGIGRSTLYRKLADYQLKTAA